MPIYFTPFVLILLPTDLFLETFKLPSPPHRETPRISHFQHFLAPSLMRILCLYKNFISKFLEAEIEEAPLVTVAPRDSWMECTKWVDTVQLLQSSSRRRCIPYYNRHYILYQWYHFLLLLKCLHHQRKLLLLPKLSSSTTATITINTTTTTSTTTTIFAILEWVLDMAGTLCNPLYQPVGCLSSTNTHQHYKLK